MGSRGTQHISNQIYLHDYAQTGIYNSSITQKIHVENRNKIRSLAVTKSFAPEPNSCTFKSVFSRATNITLQILNVNSNSVKGEEFI